VNNAGIQHVEAVETYPEEKWDALLAVILSSTFHATKAAIPIMKGQGRGRIVNIASAHGLVASAFKAPYVAAKFGVVGFTKACAVELARTGITVNCICPGYVKTPLIEAQVVDQAKTRGIPEDRVIEDVILAAQPNKTFVQYGHLAGQLLYLVSDLGASATGGSFVIDGGWTAQ
jgi:3-hydroxybutyrate dehydrogenase